MVANLCSDQLWQNPGLSLRHIGEGQGGAASGAATAGGPSTQAHSSGTRGPLSPGRSWAPRSRPHLREVLQYRGVEVLSASLHGTTGLKGYLLKEGVAVQTETASSQFISVF